MVISGKMCQMDIYNVDNSCAGSGKIIKKGRAAN